MRKPETLTAISANPNPRFSLIANPNSMQVHEGQRSTLSYRHGATLCFIGTP